MFKRFSFSLLILVCFYAAGTANRAQANGQDDKGQQVPADITTLQGDVSDAISQMGQAFDSAAFVMTPEDEYYLGRAVAAEIIKTYKLYTADPALTDYLNKICQAIIVNSPKPTLFAGYEVEILDTDEICAFATPGGHIFISRGLIACASSEDALAAVIAHEAAHIQLRHVAAILQQDKTLQQLNAVAERAASIASRNLTADESFTLFNESYKKTVNTLLRDGYSSIQEFEADRMAKDLLTAAGYNPAALLDILQSIDKKPAAGNMSMTHPSPAVRIANLGTVYGGMGRDTQPYRQPRFSAAVKP